MEVLPAFAITTFFMPSVALHVFNALSSMRVMFSRHTDYWDVRVHFAKRQLVQDLCFSGKPNPQDRHLGLAIQSLPYS